MPNVFAENGNLYAQLSRKKIFIQTDHYRRNGSLLKQANRLYRASELDTTVYEILTNTEIAIYQKQQE